MCTKEELLGDFACIFLLSPSTRRVWIEIKKTVVGHDPLIVTLHTEGVDWNLQGGDTRGGSHVTLHTEGVDWNLVHRKELVDQICHPPHGGCGLKFWCWFRWYATGYVTLHTEGVDWNPCHLSIIRWIICHPPHGGCGLKFLVVTLPAYLCHVTLHTEGVDWNHISWLL